MTITTYTVKGDTFVSIAAAHNITVTALQAANPGVVLLSVGQVLDIPSPPPPKPPTTAVTAKVTLYGWPDNSPPGGAIAYPGLHRTAGGTGTYSDPITFATDPREIPRGAIIYSSRFRKYFIMEDNCADAVTEWNVNRSYHVDLWIGGEGVPSRTVLAMEDKLTVLADTVIINPPPTLSVDLTPLLDL